MGARRKQSIHKRWDSDLHWVLYDKAPLRLLSSLNKLSGFAEALPSPHHSPNMLVDLDKTRQTTW
jgi:hypothetical protein